MLNDGVNFNDQKFIDFNQHVLSGLSCLLRLPVGFLLFFNGEPLGARSTFANPWVFLKGATYNGYAEANDSKMLVSTYESFLDEFQHQILIKLCSSIVFS